MASYLLVCVCVYVCLCVCVYPLLSSLYYPHYFIQVLLEVNFAIWVLENIFR